MANTAQFDTAPPTPDSYDIYMYKANNKIPYKICPETDTEDITQSSGTTSIAENANKHPDPLWKDWVTKYKKWFAANVGPNSKWDGQLMHSSRMVDGTVAQQREEQVPLEQDILRRTPLMTRTRIHRRRHRGIGP